MDDTDSLNTSAPDFWKALVSVVGVDGRDDEDVWEEQIILGADL